MVHIDYASYSFKTRIKECSKRPSEFSFLNNYSDLFDRIEYVYI